MLLIPYPEYIYKLQATYLMRFWIPQVGTIK